MSESLRRELMLYGIDVILIGPGSVVTPMWDKAEMQDVEMYRHSDYADVIDRLTKFFISEGRKGLPAQRIGQAVYKALTARRPKVRYAVVPQRFKNWTVPMLLPKRLLDRLIGQQTGLLASRK